MILLSTIKRIVLLTIIVTMFAYAAIIVFSTQEANASYRPAPTHLMRVASKPSLPTAGGVARRAWIICHVWKVRWQRCGRVLSVAWCESTLRPWARNGQYLGIFQMGTRERATYGHGPGVWTQARAAKRYWDQSHWTPWQCKPWA